MQVKNLEYEPFTAAIIGAGAVGGYHIKAQLELGSNIIVYDPNTTCVQQTIDRFGQVTVAKSMEEAMETADIVHVCTPPTSHAAIALASIESSKPTIIEKPLTHNLHEAVEIYQAASKTNVPVAVGMHFRLTPPFLDIYEAISKEKIGPITSIETTYVHDMRKLSVGTLWRQSLGKYGFVYEGAAHPVDLNLWLASQPVKQVQATISTRKLCPTYGWQEDHAYNLTYQNGMVGRVWSNATSPMPRHGASIAVYGSTGAYRAHNKYPVVETFTDGDKEWKSTPTLPIGQTIRPMASLFHDFLRGETDNFKPIPGLAEALTEMIVLNTIERAAESGRSETVPSLEKVIQ